MEEERDRLEPAEPVRSGTDDVLVAHGVSITAEQQAADQAGGDPNAQIPPHRWELGKCVLWPVIIVTAWVPMLWRERRHPTWDKEFETGVTTLRSGANAIGRCFCALRFITDPPVGSIPLWLPSLPESVGTATNVTAPNGGEWFFTATGAPARGRGVGNLCCANWVYPGDPQHVSDLGKPRRLILYLHGGAFCLCSSRTHRGLLMRIADSTHAIVLAPDYRRPPEHPWPTPVDDCLDTYRWLLKERSVDPSLIVFAGDSAGGGLVLAVMAAARAAGLPLPAGGAMYSPWLDLTDSCSGSWSSNQQYDFLPRDWAAKFAKAYAVKKRHFCAIYI